MPSAQSILQPHPPYAALHDCRVRIIFVQKYSKCYWRMATLIFGQKRASGSQDTVDCTVHRAANKNYLFTRGFKRFDSNQFSE